MKKDQKLTPKYWVGHNKLTDDVFIQTIDKSYNKVLDNMDLMFGNAWYDDSSHEVILVEIKKVDI